MSGKIIIGINDITLNLIERKLLSHPCVAGIILFSRNYQTYEQTIRLIDAIQQVRKKASLSKLIVFLDHEGGQVQRLKGGSFTSLPTARMVGQLFQKNHNMGLTLIKDIAKVTAIELGNVGIDVILGPVLDFSLTKKITYNTARSYSNTPQVVSSLAEYYIKELQQYGLTAAPKHFPGIGGNLIDTHARIALSDRDFNKIFEDDLLPYRYLIAHTELRAIMLSHGIYWKVDQKPVSHSSFWLKNILREKFGFSGVTITDCFQMQGLKSQHATLSSKIIAGLKAGCDLILCSQMKLGVYQELYSVINHQLINSYETDESKINLLRNNNNNNFYTQLLNQDDYIQAKTRINELTAKHVSIRKKSLKVSITAKKKIKKFFYYLPKADYLFTKLLALDYHCRLRWFKFKYFLHRLIR
jgi:beta-N-acetylhexosaminidase